MILADMSVWIEHLRRGDDRLRAELEAGRVVTHPFILGELACGNLRKRNELLQLLSELPAVIQASNGEVLEFIERRKLMGRGVGLIDAHLLASAVLTGATRLWTHDRRLTTIAAELGV